MKKALLCVGNELRGDDGVAIAVGQLVEEQLPQWKVFLGYDTPEDQFAALRDYAPDIIVVVDAMQHSRARQKPLKDSRNESELYRLRAHRV